MCVCVWFLITARLNTRVILDPFTQTSDFLYYSLNIVSDCKSLESVCSSKTLEGGAQPDPSQITETSFNDKGS